VSSEKVVLGPVAITLLALYAEAAVLWTVLQDTRPVTYVFAVSVASFLLASAAELMRTYEGTGAGRATQVSVGAFLIVFVLFVSVVGIAADRTSGRHHFWKYLEWCLLASGGLVAFTARSFIRSVRAE
jgi:hypothetical protein